MAGKIKWRAGLAALCALLLAGLLLLALRPHGAKTLLVMGMDNYGSLDDIGRSDVMLLVRLDFDRRTIYAATFARDMLVKNENGRDVKINTIVRSRDEDALAAAIERNFGVQVDGWFRVNFTSVIQLVDALGGAQVELTAKEARYIDRTAGAYPDSPLFEGLCTLNGAQALAYARCRALDNDFGRGERQGKLVAGLVASAKRLSAAKIVSVYTDLNHAWRSSLGASGQLALLYDALWLRGAKVERIGVPFEGTYRYGESSSVVANLATNRERLLEALGLGAPETDQP